MRLAGGVIQTMFTTGIEPGFMGECWPLIFSSLRREINSQIGRHQFILMTLSQLGTVNAMAWQAAGRSAPERAKLPQPSRY